MALPRSGDVLAKKYRVEEKLGEGGMGVVFRAVRLTDGAPVAVKVLRQEIADDRDAVHRLLREANAASRLRGEHVARVHSIVLSSDQRVVMEMELLEGVDLASKLRAEGRMSVQQAVGYVLEACEALAEAHALGIVHRDVKPSNLFLARRPDGSSCLKVLDFGASKRMRRAGNDESVITVTGRAIGTPQYMAPEQIRGLPDVDTRADVWALGAVLYELIVGVPPFGAPSLARLMALVLREEAPRVSPHLDAPAPGLDAIVARCLAKSPSNRFANVAELAAALAPYAPRTSHASRAAALLDSLGTRAFAWGAAAAFTLGVSFGVVANL